MVLAYRGGYWTLLQNCCRAFWNFVMELQILLKQAVDNYKTFPISQDGFLCICVLPFNLGAELLIDMLIQLQSTNSVKPVEEKGDFCIPGCFGNIKYDNGGSSLTFEHPLDDVNLVDLKWICDFVLKSLEVLYQVEKWETLVSLAIQFNIVSHERYTEQVTPLLVYAQRQLLLRIQTFNGPEVAQQACGRYEVDNKEEVSRAVSQAATTHTKGKDLGAELAGFSRGHSPSRFTNIIDSLPSLSTSQIQQSRS